jgi:hypothetical protein
MVVKMMLANSVVIKEQSDWIEYYYKCGLLCGHPLYGFPLLLEKGRWSWIPAAT